MRDLFWKEVRECNRNIEATEDDIEKKQGYELLRKTVEKMCELSKLAKHGGLLAFEEAAHELGDLHNKDFLSTIIILIVDGTQADLIEELSMAKYFAAGVEGFEGLQYLIMLYGCLAIQSGDNSRVIEEKILSLIKGSL